MHYARWQRHGDVSVAKLDMTNRLPPGTPTPVRMAAKFALPAGAPAWAFLWSCWEYQGYRNEKGYGRISTGTPDTGSETLVHRITWTLVNGPVPDGLTLDHLCDNTCCGNPLHTVPATNRNNGLRGQSKAAVNARKTHCNNGHPLDGDNLKLERDGTARRCRTCANEANRRYLAKKAVTAT